MFSDIYSLQSVLYLFFKGANIDLWVKWLGKENMVILSFWADSSSTMVEWEACQYLLVLPAKMTYRKTSIATTVLSLGLQTHQKWNLHKISVRLKKRINFHQL